MEPLDTLLLATLFAFSNAQTPTPPSDCRLAEATMRDIRMLAIGCEAYFVEHKSYPAATSLKALTRQIRSYLRSVPQLDAWRSRWQVRVTADHYEIRSLGADKAKDDDAQHGAVENPNADILFRDGRFVQWPRCIEREGRD